MKNKAFRISCIVIILLQLLSSFAVSYMSTVLSDTLQLVFGPVLLVAMLDSAPYFAVETLVKLIFKNKDSRRGKSVIMLITAIISEIMVAAVWIHFMIILREFYGDSYYISDIMLVDEIIMFFPVAAVIPLAAIYVVFRLGLKPPKRKNRRKKNKPKTMKTPAGKRKGTENFSSAQGDNYTKKGSEI